MKFEEFKESVQIDALPPADLSPCLRALWHDAKGDWAGAHRLAQDVENADGAWVHAYLHRKERDLSNARYWYHRSGRPEFRGTIDKEWEQIVRALLG